MDSKERFTARADAYAKARPSYPAETLDILRDDYGLTSSSVVADVGSGTGIFTRLLLMSGAFVHAVEPNADMRREAERSPHPRMLSVNGSAEATALQAGSIDLITAAQAFHWFDLDRFTAEAKRIVKPHTGRVALVWNDRDLDGSPFLREYEEILVTHCPRYRELQGKADSVEKFDALFGAGSWLRRTCSNEQELDREGLITRVLSASYAPARGTEGFEPLVEALERTFSQHAIHGRVTLSYTTVVIGGRLA